MTKDINVRQEDILRITTALEAAAEVLQPYITTAVPFELKQKGEPVTAADRAVNQLLFQSLPRRDEGWLSEETADDLGRLHKRRVWVVDPLDGTREFIAGIPEWCVSIGLVDDGWAVAGGIYNVATGGMLLGSTATGVRINGNPPGIRQLKDLKDAEVLASRSEVNRGEWDCFKDAPFAIRPVGSVAYKLACVAAGRADATWTLVPKHEWDVAAGVALVIAAGGSVKTLRGLTPSFNQSEPLLGGLLAFGRGSQELFRPFSDKWLLGGRQAGR